MGQGRQQDGHRSHGTYCHVLAPLARQGREAELRTFTTSIKVHEDILFWAFRYCLHRETSAKDDGIAAVIDNWDDITESTKRKILYEIREHLAKKSGLLDDWDKVLKHADLKPLTGVQGCDIMDDDT